MSLFLCTCLWQRGGALLERRVGAAGSRGTARMAGREAESTLENAFSLFQ